MTSLPHQTASFRQLLCCLRLLSSSSKFTSLMPTKSKQNDLDDIIGELRNHKELHSNIIIFDLVQSSAAINKELAEII